MTDHLTKPGDMPIPADAPVPDRVEPPTDDAEKHWLVRKGTIRQLWIGGIVVMIAVTLLDLVVHKHVHFGPEAYFGFFSIYGFVACVAMVVGAKALGIFLKRSDTFYDQPDPSAGHGGDER